MAMAFEVLMRQQGKLRALCLRCSRRYRFIVLVEDFDVCDFAVLQRQAGTVLAPHLLGEFTRGTPGFGRDPNGLRAVSGQRDSVVA